MSYIPGVPGGTEIPTIYYEKYKTPISRAGDLSYSVKLKNNIQEYFFEEAFGSGPTGLPGGESDRIGELDDIGKCAYLDLFDSPILIIYESDASFEGGGYLLVYGAIVKLEEKGEDVWLDLDLFDNSNKSFDEWLKVKEEYTRFFGDDYDEEDEEEEYED